MPDHPFHPKTAKYPLMGAEQLAELAEDIRGRGLEHKVRWCRGLIYDGRNRYLAYLRIGVTLTPESEESSVNDGLPDEQVEAEIVSLNELRLHYQEEVRRRLRAERIARVAEKRQEGKSLRAIAEEEGVSHVRIQQDLGEATVKGGLTVEPEGGKVTGKDGKERPARGHRTPRKKDQEGAAAGVPVSPATEAHETNGHSEGGPEAAPAAVDAWGVPIQPHAAAAFAAVPKFQELIAAIRKAQRLFNEVASLPGGRFLQLPAASSYRRRRKGDGETADAFVNPGLEQALQTVQNAVPAHTVCPWDYVEAPHPEDCRTCLGLHWTPPLGSSADVAGGKVREKFGIKEQAKEVSGRV